MFNKSNSSMRRASGEIPRRSDVSKNINTTVSLNPNPKKHLQKPAVKEPNVIIAPINPTGATKLAPEKSDEDISEYAPVNYGPYGTSTEITALIYIFIIIALGISIGGIIICSLFLNFELMGVAKDSNMVYKVFGLTLSLLILVISTILLIVIIRAHIRQSKFAEEANKVPDTGLVDVEVIDVMFPKLREVTEMAMKRSKSTLTNAAFYRQVTNMHRMKTILDNTATPNLQRQDSNLSSSVHTASHSNLKEVITPVEIGRTRVAKSPSLPATTEC